MATIIQKPDSLSFLRNLKPYRINSSSAITFRLERNNDTIIEETYYPDGADIVTIDVQEVCAQFLSVNLPSSNSYRQTSAKASFTAFIDGSSVGSFDVVCGGVRKISDTAANFLKANWLTWQPQTKKVRWNQPEWLTYYHASAGTVKARFYLRAGGSVDVSIYSAASGQYNSYNMEMAHLFSLSGRQASDLNGLVDVWVESSGQRASYIQRYVHAPATRSEHYYLCTNSLGGVDTFCFTGARILAPSISHESAEQVERKVNITNDPERGWSQSTGYVGKTEAVWLWEFFASSHQWAIIDGNVESIILDASSIKASDKDNLSSSTFNFTLAEEGTLLKISRSSQALPPIEIPSPAGELFFLAPRLVDYPTANLEDSLLFLVQSPYVQEWKKISLGTIKQWIKDIFLPYSELPLRVEIDTNGDNFLGWGESMHLRCVVWKGMYNDVTEEVSYWRIVRDSGDPIEDAAWNMTDKARLFQGEIDIEFSERLNDLGASDSTKFIITATIDENFSGTAFIEI